jgi:hypothetical protein
VYSVMNESLGTADREEMAARCGGGSKTEMASACESGGGDGGEVVGVEDTRGRAGGAVDGGRVESVAPRA